LPKTGRKITHIQLKFDMKKSKKKKNTIEDFVSANPVFTKGKTEWEVHQLMEKSKL
jgi:hypothetical protein